MDPQIPLLLRVTKIYRVYVNVCESALNKRRTQLSLLCCASAGTIILWKIGNARARSNTDTIASTEKLRTDKPRADKIFWLRLFKLLKICIPGFFTQEGYYLIILTLLLLSRTYLTISIANATGGSVKALCEADLRSFVTELTRVGIITIPASFINGGLKYFTNMFALQCRKRLTKYGHGKYLSGNAMYQNEIVKLSNCDQRLTTDIDKFSTSLSNLYTNTFKPLVDIFLFTNAIRYSVGLKGPVLMFGYYLGAGILLRSVMPSFAKLYSYQQRYEREFQYNHARLLAHAEEIAFYGGNELEKAIIDDRFKLICEKSRRIFGLYALVNMLDNWLIKYGATILGTLVVSNAVFKTPFSKQFSQFGSPVSRVSERAQMFARNTQLLVCITSSMTSLVLSYKKLLALSAHTTTVSELFEKLEVVCKDQSGQGRNARCVRGNRISFENVDVVTPTKELITKKLSFVVEPGCNLLVEGPSMSGKTSIFRLLSGIWPLQSGNITKPSHREIFYIPQQPYCPIGSLRDQVIYPMSHKTFISNGHHDDELAALLDSVNLMYLLQKYGWNAICDWESRLAKSEVQRLAILRILFHQPRFAILDKSTNDVDLTVEANIYQRAIECGITLITVTDHPSLKKFHQNVLKLDSDHSWQWEVITKEEETSP